MRRLLALLALLALTGCGDATSADPSDPTPTATTATTTDTSAPLDLAAVPLAAGLPDDPDGTRDEPGPAVRGLIFTDVCGTTAWPGPGVVARTATRATAPEYEQVRELLAYPDADQARAVLDDLTAAVEDCPVSPSDSGRPGDDRIVDRVDSPGGSLTFTLTYREGLGGGVFNVRRVGSALLGVLVTGEFARPTAADGVPDLLADLEPVTAALCAAQHGAGAGC